MNRQKLNRPYKKIDLSQSKTNQNRTTTKTINYANRGMILEELIDRANLLYKNQGIADVYKIPPPFQTMKNVKGTVTGYFKKGELVDYFGLVDGQAIAFDAKETKTKNLPLKNIPQHQYEFLKGWHKQKGTSFLIVGFTSVEEYYVVPFLLLDEAVERMNAGGRKSLSYKEIKENGIQIPLSTHLDYLKILNNKAGFL